MTSPDKRGFGTAGTWYFGTCCICVHGSSHKNSSTVPNCTTTSLSNRPKGTKSRIIQQIEQGALRAVCSIMPAVDGGLTLHFAIRFGMNKILVKVLSIPTTLFLSGTQRERDKAGAYEEKQRLITGP